MRSSRCCIHGGPKIAAAWNKFLLEVRRLGPWWFSFELDGETFGGEAPRDVEKVDTFFDWVDRCGGRVRSVLELGSHEGSHSLQLAERPDVVEKAGTKDSVEGAMVLFLDTHSAASDEVAVGRYMGRWFSEGDDARTLRARVLADVQAPRDAAARKPIRDPLRPRHRRNGQWTPRVDVCGASERSRSRVHLAPGVSPASRATALG